MSANAVVPDQSLLGQSGDHDPTVGELAGAASVSGGAASYRIPIVMPPGRKGMQPSVSLNYSSRAGNLVAGMGWNISAESAIHRCGPTQAQDNVGKGVTFTNDDRLCLDGLRLQVLSGSYGDSGAVYRTELDKFLRVTQSGSINGTASFTVSTKSGHTLSYGSSSDSRVVPGSLTKAYRWLLKREVDTSGNTIEYSYSQYGPGETLLDDIHYTGRNANPGNRIVSFKYQSRPDKSLSYLQGGLIAQTQRLVSITTSIATEPIRTYSLDYQLSNTSSRSILSQVTECALKANVEYCHPATDFDWYQPDVNYGTASQLGQFGDIGASDVFRQVDINGDGRSELILTSNDNYPLAGPATSRVYFLGENLSLDPTMLQNPTIVGENQDGIALGRPADINLDGKADFVAITPQGLVFQEFNLNKVTKNVVNISYQGEPLPGLQGTTLADMNSDGFTDLVITEKIGNEFKVGLYLHNGSANSPAFNFFGFIADLETWPSAFSGVGPDLVESFDVRDIDGDGLQDLFITLNSDDYIWPDTPEDGQRSYRVIYAQRNASTLNFLASVSGTSLGLPADTYHSQVFFADVNGDGLDDFVSVENNLQGWSPGWFVRVNTGQDFAPPQAIGTNEGTQYWPHYATGGKYQATFGGVLILDYDQDGDQELLVATHTDDSFCVTRVKGSGGAGIPSESICDDELQGGTEHGRAFADDDGRRFYWSLIDINVSVTSAGAITLSNRIVQDIAHGGLPGNNHGGGLHIMDLNGDGAPDFFNRIRENYCLDFTNGGYCSGTPTDNFQINALHQDVSTELEPGSYIFPNVSGVSDHLHEVTTGFGVKSTWSYAPISQKAGRSNETPLYEVPLLTENRYLAGDPYSQYFYFASSMHVVDRFWQSNGLGNGQNQKSYAYREAVYHRQGRGFQGFRTVIVEDNTRGLRSVTDFHQIFPLSGEVEEIRTCLLSDDQYCQNAPITRTSTEYTVVNDHTEKSAIYWYYPNSSVHNTYGLDSRQYLFSTRRLIESVDAYGNITRRRDIVDTGFGISESQVTWAFLYDEDNWWLDRRDTKTVLTSTVRSRKNPLAQGNVVIPASGTDHISEVHTEYLQWDLIHRAPTQVRTSVLQGGGKWRQVDTDYNSDGLITSVETRGEGESQVRRVTTTAFSRDGYFPETVTQKNGDFDLTTQAIVGPRHGQPTTVIDPNGLVTTTQYDAFGRPISVNAPGVPMQYTSLQWCRSCPGNDAVYIVQQVQDGTPTLTNYMDMLKRKLLAETQGFDSGEIISVRRVFNARGQLSFESLPSSSGTYFGTYFPEYDALDRPLSKLVDQPDSQVLDISYDYAGYETLITADTLTMSRASNGLGQLMQTVDAMGGITQYAYDGVGNAIVLQDANGEQIVSRYNALGQKDWVDDPNMGSKQFTYTGFGDLEAQTDANGDTTSFKYDLLGRVIERSVNSSPEAIFEFDTADNGLGLLSVEMRRDSNDFVRAYRYDSFSRLTHVNTAIDGDNYPVVNEYDKNYGRIKSMAYPSGLKLQYHYNTRGYLSSVQNAASGYTYQQINSLSDWGQWDEASLGEAGTHVDRVFDPATGQLRSSTLTHLGFLQQDLQYTEYDVFGNLKNKSVDNDIGGTLYRSTETYGYDNLHRLKRSDRSADDGSIIYANPTITYDYDAVGNLLAKSDYATNYDYTGGSGGPNAVYQVTKLGGTTATFRYDRNGNLTGGDGRALTYNSFNKPLTIEKNNATVRFFYGADQLRYKQIKTVDGETETTIYIDKVFERVVTGSQVESKFYLGEFAVLKNTVGEGINSFEIAYFHRDRLGSMTAEIDHNAQIVGTYGFDPFGKPRDGQLVVKKSLSSTLTPRGFTGHEHMNEVELIHMNGRAYDYNLGRFLSVDPFIQDPGNSQSLNPYSYIMNNPLAGTDPSGYISCDDAGNNCDIGSESLENVTSIDRYKSGHIVVNTTDGQSYQVGQITATSNGYKGTFSFNSESGWQGRIDEIGSLGQRNTAQNIGFGGTSVGSEQSWWTKHVVIPWAEKTGIDQYANTPDTFTEDEKTLIQFLGSGGGAGPGRLSIKGTTGITKTRYSSSFSATEKEIIGEAKTILSSNQMSAIREAHEKGASLTVKVGGRTIQYEPGLPASGMTMFGENGFLIGREAFRNSTEINKTVLHELHRLHTSSALKTGVSGSQVSAETQAAFDFAERAAQLF